MKWTQDEAIAFECAREVITDMMAIRSAKIAEEEAKQFPNVAALAVLEKELTAFARERAALKVSSRESIAKIRIEYGAQVREDRRRHRHAA